MLRTRTIRPRYLEDDQLAELGHGHQTFLAGIYHLADRDGSLIVPVGSRRRSVRTVTAAIPKRLSLTCAISHTSDAKFSMASPLSLFCVGEAKPCRLQRRKRATLTGKARQ